MEMRATELSEGDPLSRAVTESSYRGTTALSRGDRVRTMPVEELISKADRPPKRVKLTSELSVLGSSYVRVGFNIREADEIIGDSRRRIFNVMLHMESRM